MSETVWLAIIDHRGEWLTSLVALVGAVAAAWALITSRRTRREMADAREETRKLSEYVTTGSFRAEDE